MTRSMSRSFTGALIVCVVCGFFPLVEGRAFSQEPGPAEDITAEDVAARYLEAVGGAEALKRIDPKTVRYRVHMFGRDGYVMERSWERPDRMRTGAPGAPVHTVTEGAKSWRVNPEGRVEMPAAVSASFAKLADLDGPLVDSAKKGISLEYLGIERFDMSELHRMKLTFKDGVEWELYIDSRTGLLRKAKRPSFFMLNNEISRGPDTWTFYYDYRTVDGVREPHLWVQVTEDHTHAFVVEDIVLNQ